MKYRSGKDFSPGGKFLKEPGTYHVMINKVDEPGRKPNGEIIPNSKFKLTVAVQDGTVEGQTDKQADITIFNPKPGSDSDFMVKQLDRLFLATNLITEADKDKDIEIDLGQLEYKQLIVKYKLDKKGEFLQTDGAEFYHVDDPIVKAIPKKESALASYPTKFRRIGEQPKPEPKPPKQQDLSGLDL